MTIPKGSEFGFTVTVIEKDSFLPQDLKAMDLVNSSFKLVQLDSLCDVTTGEITIKRVADVVGTAVDFSQDLEPIPEHVNVVATGEYDDLVNTAWLNTTNNSLYVYTKSAADSSMYDYTWESATYLNGQIRVVLSPETTAVLEVSRGDKVDGYYLKPTYQGVISIKFTDDTPARTAIIDKIYITPTGVTCV